MKMYDVTIYGRSNSIYIAVQNAILMSVEIEAKSHKRAKEIAWDMFKAEDEVLNKIIERRDVKIESYVIEA